MLNKKTPLEIKLINALRHLVILKNHKAKYGETMVYIEQYPVAWDYATKILTELDPLDKLEF